MHDKLSDEDLVSIQEAARRSGISRRTVERWIREGRLSASQSDNDRRVRLIRAADVAALASSNGRQTTTKLSPSPSEPTDETGDASEIARAALDRALKELLGRDSQDIIDQALQLTYSHIHRTVLQVCPKMLKLQSLEDLRAGPLGVDLGRLALIAQGVIREHPALVLTAIESIVQLLFWPPGADDYSVPRSFWDTDLGRMLGVAKFNCFELSELISIGAAAQKLGVLRPTIYRWLDDRTLNYVRDEMSGRTFLVKRDVENLIRMSRTLSAQLPLPELGDAVEEDADDLDREETT